MRDSCLLDEMSMAGPVHRPLGVSIIVCCHNSETRLRPTLEHLQKQVFTSKVSWEVLVVDNASTDQTKRVAQAVWDNHPVTDLRVIEEPALGLSHARLKGFLEARYSYWALVDDDNWLDENWVQTFFDFMTTHPQAGGCGGYNDAEFEVPLEPKFYVPRDLLALGKPTSASDDEVNQRLEVSGGAPPGAGLGIRATAWDDLVSRGFQFVSTDRQGQSLSSGGDIEISMALNYLGWEIWYVPKLRLKHYMPKGRTNLKYLSKLAMGIGRGLACLDAYYYTQEIRDGKVSLQSPKLHWGWRLLAEVKRALWQGFHLMRLSPSQRKHDRNYLEFLMSIGRVLGIWSLKSRYQGNIAFISGLFLKHH